MPLKLSDNAVTVLERRYLKRDQEGRPLETPEEMFRRVARAIAEAESNYADLTRTVDVDATAARFYELLTSLEFMPNSPTLMNAGRELGQLSACFVLPVGDSMDDIFDAIKNTALIHKSGGGTGFSFSRLRPKNALVKSTMGVASGPVSFMKVFNSATEAVKQGGTRRGANMGILRVDHPDILEFIDCKQDLSQLTNFNISVAITDQFMEAVERDGTYPLVSPHDGKVVRHLKAREVFDNIVHNAWNTGEPGIVYIDRVNAENALEAVEPIEATNPCLAGDSWVLTVDGPRQFAELTDAETRLAHEGAFNPSTDEGVFSTGEKELFELRTDRGYRLRATAEHPLRVVTHKTGDVLKSAWRELGELQPGDELVLSDHRGLDWNGRGSFGEGYLLGLLVGAGTLKDEAAVLSVWEADEGSASIREAAEGYAAELPHRADFSGFHRVSEGDEWRLESAPLRDLAATYSLTPGAKGLLPPVERTSAAFHRGLLRGLFDTDGGVQGSQEKGGSIRLAQSDEATLSTVQRMLQRLGVLSTIHLNRKPAGEQELPDQRGGDKPYAVKATHELIISGDNLAVFAERIGFHHPRKTARLTGLLQNDRRSLNRERFTARISGIEAVGKARVYDVRIPAVNAFCADGFVVHNCGEQPLLPYESCNLGSINLGRMVRREGERWELDWEKLARTVHDAVHFLDNVIDVNRFPLPEIAEKTRANRKIGLGVMGFADLLIRLWIPYDSKAAVKLATDLMSFIQSEAVKASEKLAVVRGHFPNYPQSTYARRGGPKLRNAALTTVAPTGTVSIISGCSSGIEPYFALAFYRRVMDDDKLPEVNPLFREVAERRGFASAELFAELAEKGSVRELDAVPEDVRRVFVTAQEIRPADHVRIQAAFQQSVDAAVSKTINFPNTASEEQVAEAYHLAYQLGCKGITVYRDGSRDAQVLNIGKQETERREDKRRAPRPRPMVTRGRTIKMTTGCGTLYVTINEDDEGICEVFTTMGKAGGCESSQSEAVSRLISTSVRSGVDIEAVVSQLRGIRCPSPIWHGGEQILSCPDAIARAIEYYLDPEENAFGKGRTPAGKNGGDGAEMIPVKGGCPDCGGQLYFAEGCVVCPACGYSKCG